MGIYFPLGSSDPFLCNLFLIARLVIWTSSTVSEGKEALWHDTVSVPAFVAYEGKAYSLVIARDFNGRNQV